VIRRGECGLSAKNGRTRALSARFLSDPSAAPHERTSGGNWKGQDGGGGISVSRT